MVVTIMVLARAVLAGLEWSEDKYKFLTHMSRCEHKRNRTKIVFFVWTARKTINEQKLFDPLVLFSFIHSQQDNKYDSYSQQDNKYDSYSQQDNQSQVWLIC